MADGTALIAVERRRQIDGEGWTLEHDDGHDNHELVAAAECYLHEAIACQGEWINFPRHPQGAPSRDWPWESFAWKPSDDPVRNLVKAGALIAAEIERLQRS